MEEEYVRYRQATFKQKMLISKKFANFYFNKFTPVTKLEETDVKRSRYFYRAFSMGGAIAFGYISFKMRRIRIGSLESNLAPMDSELAINILNDLMFGVMGYFCGHLMSCDYIYKHRQYVLQRVYLENEKKISDRTVLLKGSSELLDEYPFTGEGIVRDSFIVEERIHPEEVTENANEVRQQVEKYQE